MRISEAGQSVRSVETTDPAGRADLRLQNDRWWDMLSDSGTGAGAVYRARLESVCW